MPTVPATDPFANVAPEPEPIPVDEYLGEEEGDFIEIGEDNQDESLPVDEEVFRDLNHALVSRKLEVLYPDEGGWFIGIVSWYNCRLGKLRVLFDDGTDDYIQPDEINDDDVKLLP